MSITSARALVLCAVLAAWSSTGSPQGTGIVRGVVTREDGLKPLAGVSVRVSGTRLQTSTSADGRYELRRVPTGRQTISFRLLGYAPNEVTVDAISGVATMNVALEALPVMLGTVIVEGASRAPELIIQAPAAVAVVPSDETRALTLTAQVPLALVNVPGVDVVQSGVSDFNVNARGFNSSLARSVLVIQDGRDLAVPFLGSQEWAAMSIPMEDFARIEMVRGPGSALYGANAFGGVLRLTTPTARDAAGTKLTIGGGELGTIRTDVRHGGVTAQGRFGYLFNLGQSRSESWSRSRTRLDGSDFTREYANATDSSVRHPTPGFEVTPLRGQRKDPATGAARGQPNAVTSVYGSARFDYYADNGAVLTADGGAAEVQNEVFVTGIGRVQVTKALRPWVRLAWDAPSFELSAWYSGRSAREPQVALASGRSIEDQSAVYQAEAQYRRSFAGERSRVIVGASLRESQVDTKGTLVEPGSDSRSDGYYGAYTQLEYDLARPVRVIVAARWDASNLYNSQFSPRAGVVFRLAQDHAFRVTLNKAFLVPSQVEFFLNIPAGTQSFAALEAGLRASPLGPALAGVPNGTLFTTTASVPVLARGNPTLVPERLTSYEVGYKGQLNARLFLTVDGFYSRVRDFVTSLLPATAVNPAFQRWTAPAQVPASARGPLENAVRQALAGTTAEFGLTRLSNGNTAIVVSYGNAGEVNQWGAELGASASLTRELQVSASYALLDFDVKSAQAGDVLEPNTPKHTATASLSYGYQRFDVGLTARFAAGHKWSAGVYRGYIPANQPVNINAGYQVSQKLRIHAVGTNILDERRFQIFGGSVIGRRVLAGVTATL